VTCAPDFDGEVVAAPLTGAFDAGAAAGGCAVFGLEACVLGSCTTTVGGTAAMAGAGASVEVTSVCTAPFSIEAMKVTFCVPSVSTTVAVGPAPDVDTTDHPVAGVVEMMLITPPASVTSMRAADPT
jgi:hypothetical protein